MKKARNSRAEFTKRLSVVEGSFWAAMVGVGTYFITPFAMLLGLSSFAIGLLRSFSMLATALGQYLGAWWMQFERSRKRLMSRVMTAQALLWIPLALIALFPSDGFIASIALIVIYSMISLSGAFVAPVWTSLMRDVVGRRERGTYFGKRNKIVGFVEFATSLIAGAFLSWMTGNPVLGFGIVFVAAFLFRLASSSLIGRHWDPAFRPRHEPLSAVVHIPKDQFFRNVLWLSAGMIFATGIANPFFAVYMLRELSFSYFEFSVALAASTLAWLITQPYWGRVIDRHGTRPVLFATAVLIPFVPLLWVFADGLLFVILIQVYAGAVWSGFDLSTFNFLLKVAPRKSVQDYAAHINGMGSLATFGGGVVGSFLALSAEGATIGLISGLQIIFVVSGIARLAIAALTVPRIARNMSIDGPRFLMRVVTVYPVKGAMAEISAFKHLVGSFVNQRGR